MTILKVFINEFDMDSSNRLILEYFQTGQMCLGLALDQESLKDLRNSETVCIYSLEGELL